MTSISGGLNASTDPSLGAFTDGQNKAILIVGLVCSCVSLLATLVTLRWFILMKRLFRHRLVLFLILSDTFKAFWYFVPPIVIFARGPIQSDSAWCQASGFFLSFAIEASDFAIFLIALHAMLYIFRPPVRIGKGGLYKYRKWIPLIWLGPPLLSASLAFVHHGKGYVTAGTFCYLPKRPIWYRLALTYIPRYVILCTIFGMYAAISIYVHVKFRGFRQVVAKETGSEYGSSDLERTTSLTDSAIAPDEVEAQQRSSVTQSPPSPPSVPSPPPPAALAVEKQLLSLRPNFGRGNSYRSAAHAPTPPQTYEPWDAMNFITAKHLNEHATLPPAGGVQAADFATPARGSASSEETRVANGELSAQFQNYSLDPQKLRQTSEAPTVDTMKTDETKATPQTPALTKRRTKELKMQDPLYRTRSAIRQQLRFLFIYPAVYALMWAFPFAQNCLLYSDYYASRPIFWLQIVSTAALSLQASMDCLVFSWREKPWRRVDQNSKFSIPFWRDQSVVFIQRVSHTGSGFFSPRRTSRRDTATTDSQQPTAPTPPARTTSPNWWEAEGKKRKDSVWMGTDLLSKITGKNSDNQLNERMDTIEERGGSV